MNSEKKRQLGQYSNIFFVNKKCPQCEKIFCIPDTSLWAYRIEDKKQKRVDYCSWNCLREFQKSKEVVSHCINCGRLLTGKSTKYCDTVCRVQHYTKLGNEKTKQKRLAAKKLKESSIAC